MPVQYYNRLPKECEADVAFVLDPVVESAETMLCVLGILKKVSHFKRNKFKKAA